MSSYVSRRTVARGAAWSVPIAAVSVAAPAFAASFTAPGKSANVACKCPGGGSPFTYNVQVTFTTPGTDSYSFHIDSFLVDGVAPATYLGPTDVVLPAGEGSPTFRFRLTNSNGTHTVQIKYTPTNTTTNVTGPQVTLDLPSVKFDPCKATDTYASCA
jgi:hypothetical protein